jgi:exodeoxyribonuclease-3
MTSGRRFDSLCEAGLIDTLRLHRKETGLFTWWDYRMLSFPKNKGLRIDAVLASTALAARCTSAGHRSRNAERQGAIDHAPIWAEFQL